MAKTRTSHKANPLAMLRHEKITPTANVVAYFRAFSDIPFAKEITEMTNAEETTRGVFKENLQNALFIAVMSEARFKKINMYAENFRNILEIAVGISPRGLIFTENPEISYVATDLPEPLGQHKRIMEELMRKYDVARPNLRFAAVNALDFRELESAEKVLPPGPILIISEGFMVYLSREEKRIVLKNIHKLLIERGGALITSDMMAVNRQSQRVPWIHDALAKTTGRDIRDSNFNDMDEVKQFLEELGFNLQLFNPIIDLVSIKKLKLENDPISQRLANLPICVLTTKSSTPPKT